jgi:hypothetical protein
MLVLAMQFSRNVERAGAITEVNACRLPQSGRDDIRRSDLKRSDHQRVSTSCSLPPQDAPASKWKLFGPVRLQELLRKEVIQPHLPVRLPCYDFTPIATPTFERSLPRVEPRASGVGNFRGVTGGVYKARERIHPGVADPGLLATPASWSRVADSNPN